MKDIESKILGVGILSVWGLLGAHALDEITQKQELIYGIRMGKVVEPGLATKFLNATPSVLKNMYESTSLHVVHAKDAVMQHTSSVWNELQVQAPLFVDKLKLAVLEGQNAAAKLAGIEPSTMGKLGAGAVVGALALKGLKKFQESRDF